MSLNNLESDAKRIVANDSFSYEIEVLSEASDADNDDSEQFELLEVTGTEVNIPNEISVHQQHGNGANNKDILINTSDIAAGHSSQSDNNETNLNIDHVRRSVRISRNSVKLKQSEATRIPNDIEREFNRMCTDADELQCGMISTDCDVNDDDDYEQLVDHASESDEWPAQGTFDDFPKDIIKDGLLQIKGEKMMSLICR